MKKILTILMFIFTLNVFGCATPKKYETDRTFTSYLEEFVMESKKLITMDELNKKVIVEFHEYPKHSTTLGTCHINFIVKNTIWISKEWWNRAYTSEYDKMSVIFHELGHCVLYRYHTIEPEESINGDSFYKWIERIMFKLGLYTPKGYLKDGCPASIMHPYHFGELCLIAHYDYYMNELFGRVK